MESAYGLILVILLALCCFSVCCISEDTQAQPPVGGSVPQEGVPLQTVGDVTGQGITINGVPRGTIDTITFTVGLAPGTKTVDMDNLTVAYADAVRTEILTPVGGYRGTPPEGYWGISSVINEVGQPNLRMEFEEQFVIQINPKAAVVPNQVITISLKTKEGKPLVIRRVAPSVISGDENVLAVI
jgi:archaellin